MEVTAALLLVIRRLSRTSGRSSPRGFAEVVHVAMCTVEFFAGEVVKQPQKQVGTGSNRLPLAKEVRSGNREPIQFRRADTCISLSV